MTNPKPGAEGLEEDGHGVAHQQHPDEPIAESQPAFDVGCPVSRVHVSDRDQIGRPGEGEQSPPRSQRRDFHRPMNVFERARQRGKGGGGGHGRRCQREFMLKGGPRLF